MLGSLYMILIIAWITLIIALKCKKARSEQQQQSHLGEWILPRPPSNSRADLVPDLSTTRVFATNGTHQCQCIIIEPRGGFPVPTEHGGIYPNTNRELRKFH